MYSVISVIVDSLPGNTKNRESTCSWTLASGVGKLPFANGSLYVGELPTRAPDPQAPTLFSLFASGIDSRP